MSGRVTEIRPRTALLALAALAALACPRPAAAAAAPQWVVTADHADGIYRVGEIVHWQLHWQGEGTPAPARYTVKAGALTAVDAGAVNPVDDAATIDSALPEPGTRLLEVTWADADGKPARALGGAVAGPGQIAPSAPAPADFDAFWDAKLKELAAVPPNPQLAPADAAKPGVRYWQVTLDNIRGTHVRAQLARPEAGEKFPALLIVQWAGVYGLQKSWVADRAAEGWLALDVSAHDLPIDRPEDFYKQQLAGPLKDYWSIGNDDREQSYFLRMYLACHRAADYLAHRPDWDGKTLVVMGGSQGGQQSLVTAAIYPGVTAALADVPAGCDMLGPTVGRKGGWPQWYGNVDGKDAAKVRAAGRYFDVVNFAPRIRCPVLVGAGLIDETCPAAGVLAAADRIASPTQVLLYPRGAHQDEHGSHGAYTRACWSEWLPALRAGGQLPLSPPSGPAQESNPTQERSQ